MQSELHGNVVHHGVEVLLLVSMLFLLAIPKSLLILKEFLYTSTYKEGVEQNGCPWSAPASNGAWTPNFPSFQTPHPVSI